MPRISSRKKYLAPDTHACVYRPSLDEQRSADVAAAFVASQRLSDIFAHNIASRTTWDETRLRQCVLDLYGYIKAEPADTELSKCWLGSISTAANVVQDGSLPGDVWQFVADVVDSMIASNVVAAHAEAQLLHVKHQSEDMGAAYMMRTEELSQAHQREREREEHEYVLGAAQSNALQARMDLEHKVKMQEREIESYLATIKELRAMTDDVPLIKMAPPATPPAKMVQKRRSRSAKEDKEENQEKPKEKKPRKINKEVDPEVEGQKEPSSVDSAEMAVARTKFCSSVK